MDNTNDSLMNDIRWLMDVTHNIDVGLVLIDKDYNIKLWNSFMQNYSNTMPEQVVGKNLFSSFPEIDENWFRHKVESVFLLKNSSFTTWEQRPYLFRFSTHSPITSKAEHMFQNTTFIPITSLSGGTDGVCLIVYDVTQEAINTLQLAEANDKLQTISRIDGLTGIFNRKTWEDYFEREFHRVQRYGNISSAIIFDIDHFKKVNDSYGHPAGDEVIRQTAQITEQCLRKSDVLGRYGGEEYVVFLPQTDGEGALKLAERIREAISQLTVQYEQHTINFTISLGIAQFSQEFDNPTRWIEAADKCLYESKQDGRNRSTLLRVK